MATKVSLDPGKETLTEVDKALGQVWEARRQLELALNDLADAVSRERQKWHLTNAAIRQAVKAAEDAENLRKSLRPTQPAPESTVDEDLAERVVASRNGVEEEDEIPWGKIGLPGRHP